MMMAIVKIATTEASSDMVIENHPDTHRGLISSRRLRGNRKLWSWVKDAWDDIEDTIKDIEEQAEEEEETDAPVQKVLLTDVSRRVLDETNSTDEPVAKVLLTDASARVLKHTASDENRSLLSKRGFRGKRRSLSWKSFLKKCKKDLKDVVDTVEDVTEAAYCEVISGAAKELILEDVTDDAGCALLGTYASLQCEAAGGGPEDPAADACAVAISSVVVASCEVTVEKGDTYSAKDLESDCGC